MDVWLSVLAFVLFLGFGTGALVCVSAVKKQSGIVIKSRLHHKLNISEVVYANLGLVGLVVLVYFKIYIFVPAVLMFVLFIVLSTRIQSGITEDGVLVGTTFIEWEFMRSFLLENQGEDKKKELMDKMMPYQLNDEFLEGSHALVFHDMPMHVGFEISKDVEMKNLDHILDQAENRRHAEKAVMYTLIKGI